MIKLQQLLTEDEKIREGSAAPGNLEGWLDTSGTCWYIKDTHAEWAAQYFHEPPPDETDIGAYEQQRIRLMRKLYDKGWVRIAIYHEKNLIYFDTFDTHWKSLTRSQKSWLYSAAIHGVEIHGDKIDTGEEFRVPPYKLQFGGKKDNIYIEPDTMGGVEI